MNNSISVSPHFLHTSNEISTFLKISLIFLRFFSWFQSSGGPSMLSNHSEAEKLPNRSFCDREQHGWPGATWVTGSRPGRIPPRFSSRTPFQNLHDFFHKVITISQIFGQIQPGPVLTHSGPSSPVSRPGRIPPRFSPRKPSQNRHDFFHKVITNP